MKFLSLSILFTVAVLGLGGCETYVLEPPSQRQTASDENAIARDEIVVLVNSRDAEGNLVKRVRQRGYKITRREKLAGLGLYLFEVEPPAGVSRSQAIREIERLEPSATAGVNHRYDIQSSADNYVLQTFVTGVANEQGGKEPRDYAGDMIGWPREGCRAAVKIGIIDSPLSRQSVDSSNAALIEARFVPGPPGKAGPAPAPAPTHGDLIAELLIGAGRVAADRLYVAAVADGPDPTGEVGPDARPGAGVFELVQALDWLQASGVRVVNVSLAGPYNKILDRAVQRAVNKNMIIVAAAGNDGPAAAPRYPAAFDSVIAVTAVDHGKQVFKHAVQGPHIALAAPGVDVYVRSGASGRYLTGTSVAAPFVTARIATDPAVLAQRSMGAVRTAVAADAEDIGPPGFDPIFGAGLVAAPANCRQ